LSLIGSAKTLFFLQLAQLVATASDWPEALNHAMKDQLILQHQLMAAIQLAMG